MLPELTAEHLTTVLARYPRPPRYWIAFSGGLDSTVLMHACCALRGTSLLPLFSAVHVHHGLQSAADTWVAHCADICQVLAVPFEVRYVGAHAAPGESPEEAARKARYAALAQLISPGEVLLTAQHMDDQAETLLLQLLRGAGIPGLAAMPPWSCFGPGFLCRPLLDFSRRSLQQYAERHNLRWIDDPSNEDLRFDRNYLRREILPRLEVRWPALAQATCRTARHCAEAYGLLEEMSDELLRRVRHPARNTLFVDRLTSLSSPRQRLTLRKWLRTSGCLPPSRAIIERILSELLPAGADRQPAIRYRQAELRRYRGELYLLKPSPAFDTGSVLSWDGQSPLSLGQANGTLTIAVEPGPGIDPRHWRTGAISVRYRQGGEALRLPNRPGTRKLKKLLQEAEVEPWTRERMPLVYIGNILAAVGDLWVGETFSGKPNDTNVRIRWERPVLTIDAQCRISNPAL